MRRALCVWSSAHRGSPARPGLVFGLDEGDATDSVRGMLFEVAPEHRRATIAYLFQRELIYPIYQPSMVEVMRSGEPVSALTFTVDRADPAYAADIPPVIRIAAIASGAGRAGRARDYLANALMRLDAMGAPEPALAAELAAADALPDDPAVLFRLFDEALSRRLDTVFQASHERAPV